MKSKIYSFSWCKKPWLTLHVDSVNIKSLKPAFSSNSISIVYVLKANNVCSVLAHIDHKMCLKRLLCLAQNHHPLYSSHREICGSSAPFDGVLSVRWDEPLRLHKPSPSVLVPMRVYCYCTEKPFISKLKLGYGHNDGTIWAEGNDFK